MGRVVYSRFFPDWTKPQTGRVNNSPHTVHAVAEIERLGRKAVSLQLDVADMKQFDGFRDALEQALKANWRRKDFDFLINNAGIDRYSTIDQTTEEAFLEPSGGMFL